MPEGKKEKKRREKVKQTNNERTNESLFQKIFKWRGKEEEARRRSRKSKCHMAGWSGRFFLSSFFLILPGIMLKCVVAAMFTH